MKAAVLQLGLTAASLALAWYALQQSGEVAGWLGWPELWPITALAGIAAALELLDRALEWVSRRRHS